MAYSVALRFVEPPVFTTALKRLMVDEQYRRLQGALMLRPEQGPVIPGSAGLRKLRWAGRGIGKRGGLRVISKHEQGDLTPAQVRMLAGLVREEFK